MTADPHATEIADATMQRLQVEWDAAHDRLLALIKERGDGEFTDEAGFEATQTIRRIAVISSAVHRCNVQALTLDERAWLRSRGVSIDKAASPER